MPKPTDHFNPEQWTRIYDSGNRDGFAFVFRRGADIAYEICSGLGIPGGLWLDIGCGAGDLANKLSQTGRTVIGLDHDPAMIDLAQKRFGTKLKFLTAGAYELPFGDESIDGLMATSLAGCLEFPERFYREVHRVLRKDGFAVLTFTNRQSVLLKINSLTRKMNNAPLLRLYKCKDVIKDLKETGFNVTDVRFYNFFLNFGSRLFPPKSIALYLEGLDKYKISRRLGRNFIITAKKT